MKTQTHVHSSKTRLPLNMQTSDSSMQQTAHYGDNACHPDSVVPLALAKTRLRRIRSMPTSPLSQSDKDSVRAVGEKAEKPSAVNEKVSSCISKSNVRIKAVVLKVKLVPFKKRAYLREAWKKKTCQLFEENALSPI